MGKIVFEKFLPLKKQEGKPQETTITLKGFDLDLEDQITLLRLQGKEIKITSPEPKSVNEKLDNLVDGIRQQIALYTSHAVMESIALNSIKSHTSDSLSDIVGEDQVELPIGEVETS
jgi:hypothetical protein